MTVVNNSMKTLKKLYQKIYNHLLKFFLIAKINKLENKLENNGISLIVFSKDRPLQLEAFIESCNINFKNYSEMYVIYNYSTEKYKIAYQEIFSNYNTINPVDENVFNNFKTTLINVLNKINTSKFIFFVDDIIFTDYINVNDLLNIDLKKFIFSLRLGLNLNYSYVVKKHMRLPDYIKEKNFIQWNWNQSDYDWAYPLSLDGNLYLVEEFNFIIKHLDFKSPNSLEDSLQILKYYYGKRNGICYENSRLFNNPCNKVQTENNNFHGEIHQDELLKYWQNGLRINTLIYKKYDNKSVHEEVIFKFK